MKNDFALVKIKTHCLTSEINSPFFTSKAMDFLFVTFSLVFEHVSFKS